MSYSHVQYLAFERRKIINHAIRIILENYPDNTWAGEGKPADVAPITTFRRIVTAFFLTDHLVDSDEEDSESSFYNAPQVMYPSNASIARSGSIDRSTSIDDEQVLSFDEERDQNNNNEDESGSGSGSDGFSPIRNRKELLRGESGDLVPEIVPMSSQKRQSTISRREMEKEMKQPSLLENPIMLVFFFFMTMQFFVIIPRVVIHLNSDVAMVALVTIFMIGRRTAISGPAELELVPDDRVNTRHIIEEDSARLLRKTLASADRSTRSSVVGNDYTTQEGPFKKFPDGAPIGSIQNCWSEPTYNEFRVRGKNYLTDRLKVTSGPFLFPLRGVDMFLSDCCPEHIAR